ncbi:MAG: alpha/beta hydrolase, partial [Phycisphaerae bacterium]
DDGLRLHGWFLPAAGPVRGTLVHCHGNAGNITGHYRFVAWLPERGWNVLVFDYRGFGESPGRPSREGAVADVHAAVDYARARPDVDANRVVLFGQSLGGSVAIVAAAERDDLAGLAVEGAFASYQEEARFVCRQRWWLWGVSGLVSRWFVADGADPIYAVGRVPAVPKLFICGTADRIVDCQQTVVLHDEAGEPKELWMLEDEGHTTALIDDEPEESGMTGRARFVRFLDSTVNPQG